MTAPARQCGDCQLCCRLLPVRSLGKKDNQRCTHQRHHKGCAVYAKLLSVSPECGLWNCRWLVNDAGDTSRPDRSHAVIDVMPDYVKAIDNATGAINEVPVVQIWIDPKYPDAHRDPALRAWLDERKEVALIRYSSAAAFLLVPPSRNDGAGWLETHTQDSGEAAHSAADVFRVLAENA